MLSSVLGSPRAIAVNIEIMRTFVRVRALADTHSDLAKRLAELEDKTEALAMSHDTFSRNTRAQLKHVFDALRELAARSAQAAHRVHQPRGQGQEGVGEGKGQSLTATPSADAMPLSLGCNLRGALTRIGRHCSMRVVPPFMMLHRHAD